MNQEINFVEQLGKFDASTSFGEGSRSVEAWFLGTRAENLDELEKLIVEALRDHGFWRRNFHPRDPIYITEEIKRQPDYLQAMDSTKNHFRELLAWLKKSVPFFSLRYQGHMNWDLTIPAILGYFATLLYNPNNVAFEASTVTTLLEMQVGNDLCQMLGYKVFDKQEADDESISAWGHITCGGTVANIEALWAARNLKFYPFTLKSVLESAEELAAAKKITIPLPNGTSKSLIELTEWELLNLKADDILAIPTRIEKEFGIEKTVVASLLENTPGTLQKMGIQAFKEKFLSQSTFASPAFFVPGTKHYSWPKAAAVLGIGSNQMRDIKVDIDARMSVDALTEQLKDCLSEQRPVLAVIAVIGSTEESAVDPLAKILELREEFRTKGLEFNVHADAAWGGYHASLLPRIEPKTQLSSDIPTPPVRLSQYCETQFKALAQADSITVDPHKSGYIPYPAGALCYRNSAMRDLLTFIAPYVHHGEAEPTVGIYGIEGSKPGAAAAAVYLSHQVIRPDLSGYGQIIGEALFNSKKLYARLLCMARPEDRFIVVPLPHLSPAIPGKGDGAKIQFVKEYIDQRSNTDILGDSKVMNIMPEIGPDQNILVYAFNFKNPDGSINSDLDQANRLNKALYKILSIKNGSDIYSYNLIVSTTDFNKEQYGEDLINDYKQRLKVGNSSGTTITVLRSTVMDPWITEAQGEPFINVLEDEFRKAVSQALLQDAIEQVFENLDTDKSGTIQLSEVSAKLEDLGYNEEEIKNIWKMCDLDGDEYLSLSEFLTNFSQFLLSK